MMDSSHLLGLALMAFIEQNNIDKQVTLIEIKKFKTDFDSIDQYISFRDSLICTSIHPWINKETQRKDVCKYIPDVVWVLTVSDQSNCKIQTNLIAFAEIEFERDKKSSISVHEVNSFDEWVTHFEPKSLGDWLMVPKLFLNYLKTGYNLPALSVTSDPWIDSVLCESRGRLIWSHQFIELIRMIAGLGITEATKLHSKCILKPNLYRKILEQIYYPPTNQTLLQIFSERTVGMVHLGSPDYFFADWLSKHYQHANQIYTAGSDKVTNDKKTLDDKAELSDQDFVSISELLPNVARTIDQADNHDNRLNVSGVASGFADLDSITSGFQHGDLIMVAGRPSMGKTTFALNILGNVALNTHLPVAIFSMDASSNKLAMQITTSAGHLNKQRMLAGEMEEDDWEKLTFVLGKLSETPIYINEESGLSSADICAESLKLNGQCGNLGLIVVDCLQLMSGPQGETRTNVADENLRALKLLAKQLHCPIIILSQLNRNLERRPDKRPILTDLQTSNYADVVLFIYRDEVYSPDSADKGIAEIIIAKHRNGSHGRVRLSFNEHYDLFENYIMK